MTTRPAQPRYVPPQPGLARVVLAATTEALRGARIDSDADARRHGFLVAQRVVDALYDHWLEIIVGETMRVAALVTGRTRRALARRNHRKDPA